MVEAHEAGGRKPWNNNNTNDRGQDSQGHSSQRGRGGNQNRGRGHGYNPQQGQQQTYTQNYQPSQGAYPYMAPPPMSPQNMIQPPPYDPNWQLRQTQFYNSPSVTGQYGQNQYSQGQQQQVPYNRDRQNPRTSKQAQHICELCGNRGHYDYQCQFATDFMQRTCRKHSNVLTICMILIRIRNGLKVMTTMIKNSLFNKGGSWRR